MKKLIVVVFSLCFPFAVLAQDSTKYFGLTSQFSINFSKYQYRLYDAHLLAGFHYKNHFLLGGLVITNEIGITNELSYENKIWPQNVSPSIVYYYKLNNWRFGAGFFGSNVLILHNYSIITYNNEMEYKNRVFTEELYLFGSRVFPISAKLSWGINLKFSFINEYNYLVNLTNDIEANSNRSRVVPSLGISLNFE